ncbi:MAG: hypothetical protein ACYCPT_05845, partial [Acidimicrobiales bacterium]
RRSPGQRVQATLPRRLSEALTALTTAAITLRRFDASCLEASPDVLVLTQLTHRIVRDGSQRAK